MTDEQGRIDLHTHTSFSDGELLPAELFARAKANNVGTISITDHDTVAPYDNPETFIAAEEAGLELIPGVEISTTDHAGRRFHVLGLHVDTNNTELRPWLDGLAASRKEYAEQVSRQFITAGWSVDVSEFAPLAIVSKAHIAGTIIEDPANRDKLVREFGSVPSRGLFIEATMNQGKPFYLPRKEGPLPKTAVEKIHAAGGVAVLAHPVSCLYEQDMSMDDIEDCVVNAGIDGLEAIYYYFSKSMGDRKVNRVKQFISLSQKLGALVTGGSDFHGDTVLLGRFTDLGMPDEAVVPSEQNKADLAEAAKKYR